MIWVFHIHPGNLKMRIKNEKNMYCQKEQETELIV